MGVEHNAWNGVADDNRVIIEKMRYVSNRNFITNFNSKAKLIYYRLSTKFSRSFLCFNHLNIFEALSKNNSSAIEFVVCTFVL